MQYLPIKTRRLNPPQDDLFSVLDESLINLKEEDLVLITSKVVAIHQGRSLAFKDAPAKRELVEQEAEEFIEGHNKYFSSPLAIKYGAMFYGAGIDESNSGEYYTFLPDEPFEAAKEIWQYLKEKHKLEKLGVIITDSHSLPLRRGVSGISIGNWGFHPINNHVGKRDLFGREMKLSSTNISDSVSAGAAAVSGETDESTPLVIAREVPNVVFTDQDTRDEVLVAPEDDIYYPVTKIFYEKD